MSTYESIPITIPRADIFAHAASLKRLIATAEETAREHGGTVPALMRRHLVARFHDLVLDLYRVHEDGMADEVREEIQRAILSEMRRSELGARMYDKPRGYAGDFETIALMYRGSPSGSSPVGLVLDEALRAQAACHAVVHRRGLLAEEIGRTMAEAHGRRAQVTSLACGPAAELFDVLSGPEGGALAATCIDIDADALEHVRRRLAASGAAMRLEQGNLVHLAFGRQKIAIPPQDLVYSVGLIDYFSDKFVVKLLDWIHGLLRPGGRVILGNFHPDNSSRGLMEIVFEWNLIHRTEADMDRLYRASKFGRGCTAIRFEGEGVNLFAECVKR